MAALEQAGVAWTDIKPFDLSPADAAAAFDRDSIDAWSIWDPFFAVAQDRYAPRVLATADTTLDANTFLLANSAFATAHPGVIRDAITALGQTAAWAEANKGEVAAAVHAETKVDLAALERAIGRASFFVHPIDDRIIKNQQATADRFQALGLIPKPIVIREAVWTPPQT